MRFRRILSRYWGSNIVAPLAFSAVMTSLAWGAGQAPGGGTGPGVAGTPQPAHRGAEPTTAPLKPIPEATKARQIAAYGKLPLSFEPNQGQSSPQVKFLSHGRGYTLFLTPNAAVVDIPRTEGGKPKAAPDSRQRESTQTSDASLQFKLVHANPAASITGGDELPGKVNYFIGNDPKQWHTNLPTYSKVRYRNVYPGIDLVYYGDQSGQLEYDFVVAPGADPSAIALDVAAMSPSPKGGRRPPLQIDANGDLVIPTEVGELRFRKPVVYQEESEVRSPESGVQGETQDSRFKIQNSRIGNQQSAIGNQQSAIGNRQFLNGSFVLDAQNRVHFALGAYDHRKPLIIDPMMAIAGNLPTLSYSTFVPSTVTSGSNGIAVDSSGNVFLVATAGSSTLPIMNPLAPPNNALHGSDNIYIAEINPAGTELLYATYLGGSDSDSAGGIALDSNGDIYVAGATNSTDFPTTTNAYQTTLGGARNAFVTELNATGSSIVYSTYLGGSGQDGASGIAVSAPGSVYVAGGTSSTNFPTTTGAYQTTLKGNENAFVSELNTTAATGSASLVFSTYIGGSGYDSGVGIGVDGSGGVVIDGRTTSTNFPTTNGVIQPTFSFYETFGAGFLTRLNSTGTALVYSTYLGGNFSYEQYDEYYVDNEIRGLFVDSAGNAYVAGSTTAENFPVQHPFQTDNGCGESQIIVAKFGPTGIPVYSTYFGYGTYQGTCTAGGNVALSIAADSSGNAYFTGYTLTDQFPSVNAVQSVMGGGLTKTLVESPFVTELNPSGSTVLFSTYLDGSSNGEGQAIAVDSLGNIYVAGQAYYFPVIAGGYETQQSEGGSFLAKISSLTTPALAVTPQTVTFPAQAGGIKSSAQTVLVHDMSANSLSVSNISFGGTNGADFGETDTCSSAVAGGTDCSIAVTITPSTIGAETGTMTITGTDAIGSPTTITLTGTGASDGIASFSTTSPYFGYQLLGTSAQQTVTLTNTGTGPLGSISISIPAGGDFSQTNNCPSSLAVSAFCTITVTYAANVLNYDSAYITVTDDAPNSPQSILASGYGAVPLAQLVPALQALGSWGVGTTSYQLNAILYNNGGIPMTISGITIGGTNAADFSIAPSTTCGSSVAAYSYCEIYFTFTPSIYAPESATLMVTDNSNNIAGSIQTMSLTGTGVHVVQLSASSLNFGNQTVNTASGTRTETFGNFGASSFTINSITASGPFSASNGCGTSLGSRTTCNIYITFKPTTLGAQTGAVTITYTGGPGSPMTITLGGNGINAPLTSCPVTFPSSTIVQNYGHLPLSFEANAGQTDPSVKFLSHGRGYGLFLAGEEAVLKLQKSGVRSQESGENRPLSLVPGGPLSAEGDPALETNDQGPMTKDSVLRMKLLGANANAKVAGFDELPGKSNYFIGNDPSKWVKQAPTYAKVRYQDVYPGIDVVYYGNRGGQLEYDFVVAPGADPGKIAMAVGAGLVPAQGRPQGSPLRIAANGDLVVPTDGGEVVFHKPVVYQEQETGDRSQESGVQDETQGSFKIQNSRIGNRQSAIDNRQFLDGHFVLTADNRVTFAVGPYDPSRPLVIDPVLNYATYLGGSGTDLGIGIAVDASCSAYISGETSSTDFPLSATSPQDIYGGGSNNAFVTKLSPDGTAIVYSTYLGGYTDDEGRQIAVDSSGDAYLTGLTQSNNFPTTSNAYDQYLYEDEAAFLSELSPDGSTLLYSTYFGAPLEDDVVTGHQNFTAGHKALNAQPHLSASNGIDFGFGIAVASPGYVYISGSSASPHGFPTTEHAYQTLINGTQNTWVAEFNTTAEDGYDSLLYSTLLGGSGVDQAYGITLDSSGNVYVTGSTTSSDFPTMNAYQATLGGGGTSCGTGTKAPVCGDAFVAELNSNLSGLLYSTFLGGSGEDGGAGIAVDSSGKTYVSGGTDSSNFPTSAGALQTALNSSTSGCANSGIACGNAFVAKLDTTQSGPASLLYSTYLGGENDDIAAGIAVDSYGDAVLAGITNSTHFPTVNPLQSFGGGSIPCHAPKLACGDAFLAILNPTGNTLTFSTYLGGSGDDGAFSVAMDSFGNSYITGATSSANFPATVGAFQTTYGGGVANAFAARLTGPPPAVGISFSPSPVQFGSQPQSTTSAPQSLTITNIGTATSLHITNFYFSSGNPPFALASGGTCNTDGTTLAPGASCTLNFTFSPTATGAVTPGVFSFTDNAAASPQSVSLTGTGTSPTAGLSVSSLNFDNQVVNTTSGPRTESLANSGTGNLPITSILASGPFSQANNCGTSVAAGSSCNITITFTPTTVGPQTGAVTINYVGLGTPAIIALSGTGISAPVNTCPATAVAANYGHLPLSFEANAGQTDSQVKFLSRGHGYGLFLTGDEAVLKLQKAEGGKQKAEANRPLSLVPGGPLSAGLDTVLDANDQGPMTKDSVLRMKLLGANPDAKVTGSAELSGKSNYFIGNDPSKWVRNAPTFAQVRYAQVYPGIDLVYYGNQGGQLEYDFVVAPGADPGEIALDVGAGLVPAQGRPQGSPLRIADNGDLVISTDDGELRFHKPLAYQEQSKVQDGNRQSAIGNQQSVDGRFVLTAENQIRFEVGPYDRSRPLVIDPVLVYSTYLGGSGEDGADAIAVDSSCNAYIAGYASSSDFPTANPFQASLAAPGEGNAFVTKLNSTGTALVYSTFLGGSVYEYASAIAVDSSGDTYITGETESADFPTAHPVQVALAGVSNAFVAELNPTGSGLVYSTYLGGNDANDVDTGYGIAVDSSGNAYVIGQTDSTNFPTANPLQAHLGGTGASNAFVSKLNWNGSALSLVYSTYLGGGSNDYGAGIAIDSSGNAYVAGGTNSTNFPTMNPIQASLGGSYNVFVTKLNPAGSALVYSTYLGGNQGDVGNAIAVDSSGSAYVTGYTNSGNFPTQNPLQGTLGSAPGGDQDAFVTKLNAAGSALIYSTYLGGNGTDSGQGIAVDASGNAYVAGYTYSTNFPTQNPIQAQLGGPYANAFVSALNPTGSALLYSTYLGGSYFDYGDGIALDASGDAYVAGQAYSANFPITPGAFQTGLGGEGNAFVAMISSTTAPGVSLSSPLTFSNQVLNTTSSSQGVTLTSNGTGILTISSITLSGNFALATTATSCPYNGGTVAVAGTCTLDVTFTPLAAGTLTGSITINDNAAGSPQTVGLTGTGVAPPSITKLFGTATIPVNGTTSLTFTITNPAANTVQLNGIDFTDTLPAGLLVATPSNLNPTSCGGESGIVTATAGSNTINLTNGYLATGGSCTFSLNVTGNTAGVMVNSVTVTSTNGGTGNTSTATLTALNPPSISESFGTGTIAVTGVTSLTFTINNPSASATATGIGFTDNLPSGVAVATPNGLSGTCGGGTITAVAGSSTVSLAGASLPASGSCTFSINVTGTSATGGPVTNSVSVSSTNGGTGNTATAGLTVVLAAGVVSPPSLTFASDDVNNPSASQPVTLQNISSSPLGITGISVIGANPADFTLGGTCGTTLAAGATCQINVTFDPTATGSRSGTLQVTYSAPGSPQTVALSGTGVAPTAQVSVTSLSYSHNLNTTCPSKPVMIQNNGTGPLLISSITTGTSFSQTNTCGTSLAAGANCEIDVSFAVQAPIGTYNGTLTVNDNVPGSAQQTVPLSGTVYPPCPLAAANSTQQLLRTTPSATFNISDPQPSCHTSTITMACTNNTPATCVFNPPAIAPGGSTVLTVQNLDAVGTDNFSFTAQGTDTAGTSTVSLAVAMADFTFTPYTTAATVTAGQTASYALTLTPVNGLAGTIQLGCQGAPSGSTCTVTPASVSLSNNYPAQATVTVSTAGRSLGAPRGGPPLSGPGASLRLWLELASLLALLALAAWAAAGRRAKVPQPILIYRRVRLSALALAALALMLMAWAACGGGGSATRSVLSNPGTPAGTYALTVTGTFSSSPGQATALVRTQPLSLQVN